MSVLFITPQGIGFALYFREDSEDDKLELVAEGVDNSFTSELDIDNPIHVLYKGLEVAFEDQVEMEHLMDMGTEKIMEDLQAILKMAQARVVSEEKTKVRKTTLEKANTSNVLEPDFWGDDGDRE